MDSKNITCIQRVRFLFHFFKEPKLENNEKFPWEIIVKDKIITPQEIISLKDFLNRRLDRIARMIEILLKINDNWGLTSTKEYIIMETEEVDFNIALKELKKNGFSDDEFELKVEYDRKWGLL